MPIAIRETVEPFSRVAVGPGTGAGGSILIESEAYRLLKQEAERYVRGVVRGRSFLIAGHRGSGKTTLVLHVCQELRQVPPSVDRRVLPVFLHGPNLLPDLPGGSLNEGKQVARDHQEAEPDESAGGPPRGNDEPDGEANEPDAAEATRRVSGALSEDETENALIQITLELYRALAREVTTRFRAATRPVADRAPSRAELARLELAAQLEAELDRCPEPARLREVWARCGFLPGGVLFRNQPIDPEETSDEQLGFFRCLLATLVLRYRYDLRPSLFRGSRQETEGRSERAPDQGFRELLALSSACEMYRRISGSFTRETGSTSEAAREISAGVSVDTKGQDLVAPVAALLTGGLAGVAAASAGVGADPLTAAFTGLLAALGAAAVFKVSGSRSRKRSYVEESKFVRDLTVSTLDREIPTLVERCLDAGLVPLFIVDELDKVQGLSDRITSLVRRLKKLVAERAFFCFLADRQYFEEMRGRTRSQPYPIEYTYFTHDLFVVFDHRDFHRYLLRAVAPAEPAKVSDSLREALDGARTPLFHPPFPSELPGAPPEETEDLRILRYVLLHRAKMHTIDLRRLLTRLQGAHGILEVPPGAWRTRAHLCDLVIQVAVEMVLEGEAMTERIRREPGFLRLAHDALYHPSRRWENKEYDLDLSDEQEGAFGRWLVDRMGHEPEGERKGRGGAGASEGDKPELVLADQDRRFLFERVRELAHLLADEDDFENAFLFWQDGPGASPISEELRLTWASMESHAALVLPLLEPMEEGEHRYRWRLDYSGLDLQGPEVPEAEGGEDLALAAEADGGPFAKVARVRAFAGLFDELHPVTLTTLTSELRILGISPAWSEVERALLRLDLARALDGTPEGRSDFYEPVQKDLQTVQDFHELLEKEHETLALALLCGAVLGRAVRQAEGIGDRLLAGLRAISRMYRFDAQTAEGRLLVLAGLREELLEQRILFGSHRPPPELRSLSLPEWKAWIRQVRLAGHEVAATPSFRDTQRASWRAWEERLTDYTATGRTRFEPRLSELWCAAADLPPSDLLLPDLKAMRLGDWSQVVFAAVMGSSKTPGDYPLWLAVPALHALGFRVPEPSRLIDALGRVGESRQEPSSPGGPGPLFASMRAEAQALLLRSASPNRQALLVRRSERSLTDGWMPARQGAVLALTQEQLWESTLVDAHGRQPPLIATLDLDLIVVELAPAEEPGPEAPREKRSKRAGPRSGELKASLGSMLTFGQPDRLSSLLAKWGREPAVLYVAADSSVTVPAEAATLYAPSDADEILTKAPPPPARDQGT